MLVALPICLVGIWILIHAATTFATVVGIVCIVCAVLLVLPFLGVAYPGWVERRPPA